MGSEKYRLKWSKYESNILSHFQTFLETQALSDVTLFCEGKPVAAYRDPNLNKAFQSPILKNGYVHFGPTLIKFWVFNFF